MTKAAKQKIDKKEWTNKMIIGLLIFLLIMSLFGWAADHYNWTVM